MAIKQRKQLTGTTAQINAYAGVEGQLVWDKTKKKWVGMSGTAGTNYPMASESHTHSISNVTNLQTTLNTINDKIPKTGNRGALAGYSTSAVGTTVDASANDSQYATSGAVTVKNGATGQAWTKVVKMSAGTVTLESNWAWVDGEAPELSFPCLLICHWNNDKGIAGVVKGAA